MNRIVKTYIVFCDEKRVMLTTVFRAFLKCLDWLQECFFFGSKQRRKFI